MDEILTVALSPTTISRAVTFKVALARATVNEALPLVPLNNATTL